MNAAPRRWPLILLALPAAVATWSGWVGLGEKTGFGVVKPLPGIADFTINTAVCLPIGVEAYAAFALSAWLTSATAATSTRRFAKWSALGSLALGMLGQVAYHVLETARYTTAPVWVTTAVACLPVLVLGMGAALGHMLARDRGTGQTVPSPSPGTDGYTVDAVPDAPPATGAAGYTGPVWSITEGPEPAAADPTAAVAGTAPGTPVDALDDTATAGYTGPPARHDAAEKPQARHVPGPFDGVPEAVATDDLSSASGEPDDPDGDADVPVDDEQRRRALSVYFSDVTNGNVPSIRAIKNKLGVGQARAAALKSYLRDLAETSTS